MWPVNIFCIWTCTTQQTTNCEGVAVWCFRIACVIFHKTMTCKTNTSPPPLGTMMFVGQHNTICINCLLFPYAKLCISVYFTVSFVIICNCAQMLWWYVCLYNLNFKTEQDLTAEPGSALITMMAAMLLESVC